MSAAFVLIDDKHVPLARIVWVSDLPHFCGSEECNVEGKYEIRVEADDSLFATTEEKTSTLEALEQWLDR
nr:hypothetical protein [uncultured bacterium]